MATVSIETGSQWFLCKSSSGSVFKNDDVVTFTPGSSDTAKLEGRVTESKTTNFGNPPVKTLQLRIAITAGDLSNFTKNDSFANYKINAKVGDAKAIVHPSCKTKFSALLLKTTELQKMFEMATKLIKAASEGKSDDKAKKWFGTIAPSKGGELERIHTRCAELNKGVGEIANAVFEVVGGEFLGGIDPNVKGRLKGGGTCRIQLGRGFTFTRYSWGEKVATIVHELTHWILNTVDAKYGSDDAYGPKCIALTKDARECSKALNNADNWAFYICEYRGEGGTEDWKYFTEDEMTERGPFSDDPKNTDLTLVQ